MPRPTQIARRYKRALGELSACDVADRETWLRLLRELQGLCEAMDQTAERLYRLERVVMSWSGSSREGFERSLVGEWLPESGDGLGGAVHRALVEGEARRGD